MNYDWPGNNNKLFKSKSGDGKWKHVMYDSDFGFERWGANPFNIGSYETYNMLDHAIGESNVFNNPVWSTAVFTTLLENMNFRNKFINTYCDRLNTTYSTENTLYFINQLSVPNDRKRAGNCSLLLLSNKTKFRKGRFINWQKCISTFIFWSI